ncbi:MAG TPA: porin, partial [Hyphomicrobiaceae bacterium]|nr:porin [Hyphomicrobiaceae bacterium]
MIGGLKKTTSRFAIAAAASVIATSAMAADLGGNCCADLEERIAELEATTARKGNRRVSLTVYGQVNEGVLWWDDGEESNAYVVTNENSRTRFGFRGDARINPEWSAGFLLEIGVRIANSGHVNQFVDDNVASIDALDLRHSAWYIESNRLGRVWVGHTNMATEGITEINLSNAAVVGAVDVNNFAGGFFVRLNNGRLLAAGSGDSPVLTGLRWRDLTSQFFGQANPGDGTRANLVRYVSPTFSGFTFSASWGEDDFWDVALRYANEFNGVRVAGGIGYQKWTDGNSFDLVRGVGEEDVIAGVLTGSQGEPGCADLHRLTNPVDAAIAGAEGHDVDCHALGLSGSVMHVPTGLYLFGAYGFVKDENRRLLFALGTDGAVPDADDRDEFWYVQAGIEKNFTGLGNTTIYGEFYKGDAGAGLNLGAVRNIG